jgi:hypothetical protein
MTGIKLMPHSEFRNALSKNDRMGYFDNLQNLFADRSNVAVSSSKFWKSHPTPMDT